MNSLKTDSTDSDRHTILTGDRPSGPLHLGHSFVTWKTAGRTSSGLEHCVESLPMITLPAG